MNTTQKGFTLIELMIVVAIIGILAAIAIPQYQNYITKSQVSRVMAETGNYKTAVEDCVNSGKVSGDGDGECGEDELGLTASNLLGAAGPVQIGDADGVASPKILISDDGTATIEGIFGNSASANLKNNEDMLHWTRDEDGNWECETTVDAKYAPAGCTSGVDLSAIS